MQDVVQKYELGVGAKQVCISAHFIDPGPWVYADIGMIERVLSNLIDNALRHTPEGSSIALTLQGQTGGSVRVWVSDTGTGIPDELLFGLFERESPLRRTSSKLQGGGLGLLIARRILELHGGTIQATSREGQGATFEFDLPVAPMPPNPSLESNPTADR